MMLHAAQIDGTLQFLRFHGMPLKQPSLHRARACKSNTLVFFWPGDSVEV